jgi:hypothetical protein
VPAGELGDALLDLVWVHLEPSILAWRIGASNER